MQGRFIKLGQSITNFRFSEHAAADITAFRECVRSFDTLLELQAKIAPRPVAEKVWRDFMGLSRQRRRAIIEQLRGYTAILSAASKDGISLIGEKRLAWFAMRLLKLVPPSGFLDLIKDGDYFEIYNADGLQIFRNLEFYKLISYTIAEIAVYRWDQLYSRAAYCHRQIVEQCFEKGFSGDKTPYKLNIDDHETCEAMSKEARMFYIWPGWLVPLSDQNRRVVAFFATSKRKRLYF